MLLHLIAHDRRSDIPTHHSPSASPVDFVQDQCDESCAATYQGATRLTRTPCVHAVRRMHLISALAPYLDALYCGEPGWSTYAAMLAFMIRHRS